MKIQCKTETNIKTSLKGNDSNEKHKTNKRGK